MRSEIQNYVQIIILCMNSITLILDEILKSSWVRWALEWDILVDFRTVLFSNIALRNSVNDWAKIFEIFGLTSPLLFVGRNKIVFFFFFEACAPFSLPRWPFYVTIVNLPMMLSVLNDLKLHLVTSLAALC